MKHTYRVTIYWRANIRAKNGRIVRRWLKFKSFEFDSKAEALKYAKVFSNEPSDKVTLQRI